MPVFNSPIAIASNLQAKDSTDFYTTDRICPRCGNPHSIPAFLGIEDVISCSICDSLIWTKCDCYPLKH
jgi:Ni,Fe-hydrogenase I large subunit